MACFDRVPSYGVSDYGVRGQREAVVVTRRSQQVSSWRAVCSLVGYASGKRERQRNRKRDRVKERERLLQLEHSKSRWPVPSDDLACTRSVDPSSFASELTRSARSACIFPFRYVRQCAYRTLASPLRFATRSLSQPQSKLRRRDAPLLESGSARYSYPLEDCTFPPTVDRYRVCTRDSTVGCLRDRGPSNHGSVRAFSG